METPNVLIRAHYYGKNLENPKVLNSKTEELKEKRLFYSSKKDDGNDYVKYIDTGSKNGEVYKDYVDYSDNKEKSSGVFNENGLLSPEDKKKFRNGLRTTDSVVWDVVISFKEKFGKDNLTDYSVSQKLLKVVLPKFFSDNYLNYENIRWVAALHENTDNRHIHLCFYEEEPRIQRANKPGLQYHRGNLTKKSFENFKLNIEKYFSKSLFKFEQYRDSIIKNAKEVLDINKLGNHNFLVRKQILEIATKLPKEKLGYNSLKLLPIKDEIDKLAKMVIEYNPVLKAELRKLKNDLIARDSEIKELCRIHKIDSNDRVIYEKYMNDLNRRIGNVIIKFIRNYQFDETFQAMTNKQNKYKRIQLKINRKKMLNNAINLTNQIEYMAEQTFENYRNDLARAEYSVLKENGYYDEI